jgi:hypothetical protein
MGKIGNDSLNGVYERERQNLLPKLREISHRELLAAHKAMPGVNKAMAELTKQNTATQAFRIYPRDARATALSLMKPAAPVTAIISASSEKQRMRHGPNDQIIFYSSIN